MRSIISVCALFFAVLGAASFAQANINITCLGSDCLTQGWEVYDELKDESLSVVCRNSNCSTDGWTGVFKEVAQDVTQCKGGNCFKYGWSIYDNANNQLKMDVTCRLDSFGVSDCLRSGWDIRDYQNRMAQTSYCLNGDCRNIGWDVYTPGYPIIATRCKFGGCFQVGWISYR